MIKKLLSYLGSKGVWSTRRVASAMKFGAGASIDSTQSTMLASNQDKALTSIDANVPTINIIDRSTLLDDGDFLLMTEAVKIQMEKHVAPLWMRGPWKIVVNQPENVGYPVVILDDPDQAGMLGYHTKSPGGKVWARVFVKAIFNKKGKMLEGPMSVSAILSHEVIEAYIDPDVNLWAKTGEGTFIAYEAVDPVENDYYDIEVSGGRKVSVSNFVLPAWFCSLPAGDAQFDYLKRVRKPFTMSKGGYVVSMNPKTGKVSNVFGSLGAEKMHAERQEPYVAARSTRKISDVCEDAPETIIATGMDDDGDA